MSGGPGGRECSLRGRGRGSQEGLEGGSAVRGEGRGSEGGTAGKGLLRARTAASPDPGALKVLPVPPTSRQGNTYLSLGAVERQSGEAEFGT